VRRGGQMERTSRSEVRMTSRPVGAWRPVRGKGGRVVLGFQHVLTPAVTACESLYLTCDQRLKVSRKEERIREKDVG